MIIVKFFQKPEKRFLLKSCRDVSFEFIQDGYSVKHKYSKLSFKNDNPSMLCFDDLDPENNLKYYGNDCNVIVVILLFMHDLFVSSSMLTHLTTNLNSSKIEELYGTRIRSCLLE